MKCPKCNLDNPDDSKFCKECGTNITSVDEAQPTITKTIETPREELTTGSTFAGRYQIIEELGKGGMGKVYKVHDRETNEKVALKLIKPEIASDKKTIERFRNELTTARKISHRNVCRMYDLSRDKDTYYITMEYVPGEDLKSLLRRTDRLTVGKAVFIASQICDGLTEAHKLGIVHRDLKPQNIMIDRNGDVRIMDFGIARSLQEESKTGPGVMIGTPEYMSPEQAEAKMIDQRTDIYALGIILYEMLTGEVPFTGDSALSIALKHKVDSPRDPRELNPQIPEDLGQLILKCLKKDKEVRYQRADELLSEFTDIEQGFPSTKREIPKRKSTTSKEITVSFNIRKIIVPASLILIVLITVLLIWRPWGGKDPTHSLSEVPIIAVLPFGDPGVEVDQETTWAGMADRIIAKFSRLKSLKVMNWTTVTQLRNTEMSFKESVRDLNITHFMTGRVQTGEQNIQVTVQLIDAKDSTTVWQESFDMKSDEIFDIQNSVVESVAHELRVELSAEFLNQIQKRPTESNRAYDLYQRGRRLWNLRTAEGLMKSIQYYEQAVQEDPDFALAHAGIAEAYVLFGIYGLTTGGDLYQKAREAAQKALAIDNSLGEAYSCLGMINFIYDWDWEEAERDFKKAIELNPSYATAHHWYGNFLVSLARLNEAKEEFLKASELDPLSLVIQVDRGNFYILSKEFDLAIELLSNVIEMSPDFPSANPYLGIAYYHKERYTDAFDAFANDYENQLKMALSLERLKILAQDLADNPEALSNFKKLTEESGRAPKPLDELKAEMELVSSDNETLSSFKKEMDVLIRKEIFTLSYGIIYVKTGKEDEARAIFETYKNIASWGYGAQLRFGLAELSFALCEYDQGFSYLEEAIKNKDIQVLTLKIDPSFDNVRSLPRFKALLKKMNLY
ncbi:protein kinase [Acidobacteriota bacterium]